MPFLTVFIDPSLFRGKERLVASDTTRWLDLALEPPLERGTMWSMSLPSPLWVVPAALAARRAVVRSVRFLICSGFELYRRFSFL